MQFSVSGELARRACRAQIFVWLCVGAPLAYAQALPPVCPSQTAWQKASPEDLAAWAEACDENALFHAFWGAQLLAKGKTEAAAIALEKALLINSDLPGAQLDYAQALAQIGLKGSARAILNEVLQRPDIQPQLKSQLSRAQFLAPTSPTKSGPGQLADASNASALKSPWQWTSLAQATYGYETNLNSATHTDSLTLYLSNGPVTLGLSDNAKPLAGNAAKTTLAAQAIYKGAGSQELAFNAALNSKLGAGSSGGNNQTAEGAIKFSVPMLAGSASGIWQLSGSGTQFWIGSQTAYLDQGLQLKFAWDSLGSVCKWAPAVGAIAQAFPQSASLNGTYTYARLDWVCAASKQQETHLAIGAGQDKAQNLGRLGGNRQRSEVMVRHEQLLALPTLPTAQFSAWLRFAQSKDQQAYSELLGDLKSNTKRADAGLGFWVPVAKNWSLGLNLEATSQKSNNTLFNLKNSGIYAGLRWVND